MRERIKYIVWTCVNNKTAANYYNKYFIWVAKDLAWFKNNSSVQITVQCY